MPAARITSLRALPNRHPCIKLFQGEAAGKQVFIKALVCRREDDPGAGRMFANEVDMLRRVGPHPGVIELIGVDDRGNDHHWHRALIMERAESSLEGHRPERCRSLALELASTLAFLHSKGVAHRDLKPGNILLTKDRRTKLADFGVAVAFEAEDEVVHEPVGSRAFMAPELLAWKPYKPRMVDVYAFGMVLYELLHGEPPFSGLNSPGMPGSLTDEEFALAVTEHGLRPRLSPKIPPSLAQCLKLCWHSDAEFRPSFAQLAEFGLQVDYVCVAGPDRPANEDRVVSVPHGSSGWVIGVLDGHLGDHLVDQACVLISQHAWKGAYPDWTDFISRLDASLEADLKKVWSTQGAAATLVHVGAEELNVGWVGDCEAIVVMRNGDWVDLTVPRHRPDEASEAERVISAGGRVGQDHIYVYGQRLPIGPTRVFPTEETGGRALSLSRALGSGRLRPFVTSQASVATWQRTGQEAALVVGSDGLWERASAKPDVARRVVEALQSGRAHVDGDQGLCNTLLQDAVTAAHASGAKCDNVTALDTLALRAARYLALIPVTAVSRFYLSVLNDFKVVGDADNYRTLLDLVDAGAEGRNGRALLTVANHTSVLDDPVLQANFVGWNVVLQPEKHRWGICKQSICFSSEFASSFVGAGKVLPITVGHGLEQAAFAGVARRVAAGDWVHIYPEAACIQTGKLGLGPYHKLRAHSKAEEIGRLKWGVGKLAAHCVGPNGEPPIIVPYYHVGMHRVMPQVNKVEDNSLVNPYRIAFGERIRVRVGRPVDVSDLLAEFEKSNGPRRKVAVAPDGSLLGWEGSSPEERELYSMIAKRVEAALLVLEEESKEDFEPL